MTFEQRAAELNAAGWLINNCFQLDNGTWRASVRRKGDKEYSAFCPGATPVDALDRTMKTVAEEVASVDDMLG